MPFSATPGGLPANVIVLPNGQVAQMIQPGAVNPNVIQAIRPQMPAASKSEPGINFINQLDGAAHISGGDKSEKPGKVKKCSKLTQLDGGPGLSDSSSEEELEDEEDDPLRRIADRIGNEGDAGDEDDKGDEIPLNSDDDQSDDEDLETLFDSSNVVVCQFEKVC